MYLARPLPLVPMVFAVALSACSSTDDWPNLSDTIPDPAARDRVIERVDPAIVPREQDQTPTSMAEAEALLDAVTTDTEAARQIYDRALDAFTNSDPASSDQVHLWLEAQLALTRLSQTLSRLDVILFNDELAESVLGKRVRGEKQRIDSLIVAERQALAAARPEEVS